MFGKQTRVAAIVILCSVAVLLAEPRDAKAAAVACGFFENEICFPLDPDGERYFCSQFSPSEFNAECQDVCGPTYWYSGICQDPEFALGICGEDEMSIICTET